MNRMEKAGYWITRIFSGIYIVLSILALIEKDLTNMSIFLALSLSFSSMGNGYELKSEAQDLELRIKDLEEQVRTLEDKDKEHQKDPQ